MEELFGFAFGVWSLWTAQSVHLAYAEGLVAARTYGPGPAERPGKRELPEFVVRLSVDVSAFERGLRQVGEAARTAGHQLDALRYALEGAARRRDAALDGRVEL